MQYLFVRFYWFYKNIIREKDEVMIYYFASFAISLLIYFYIHLFWSILYYLSKVSELEYNGTSFTIIGFIFVGSFVYMFFKSKKLFQREAERFKKKFDTNDIGAILFAIGGLASMILSMVIFKAA